MRVSMSNYGAGLAILLAVFSFAGGSGGLQAEERKPLRLDQYGDPLPEGAVARLGTLRLVHLGVLTSVAVSPDGKVVASGVCSSPFRGRRATRATIRLWESSTGKLIREIPTPDAPVTCLYFGDKGASLFAGCGHSLCAWDASTGKKLWEQETAFKDEWFNHGVDVTTILLANDKLISFHSGRLMCAIPEGGGKGSYYYHKQQVVRFWNGKTGKPLPLPPALESTVHAEARIPILFHEVAVSADGKYAAVLISQADPVLRKESSSEDKWNYTERRLQIIDLNTRKVTRTFPDDKGTLRCLAFAEEGHTLALAAGKEVWLVRPAKGGKELLAKDLPAGVSRLTFAGRSKQLAAHLDNDSIHVWEVGTKKRVGTHHIGKPNFFLTAKGGRVVATTYGNTVLLLDRDTWKPLHSFEGHRRTPFVRFSASSRDTLLSSDSEVAYRWDVRAWKSRERFVLPGERVSVERGLYLKDGDKRLELRDLRSGRLLRSLEGSGEKGNGGYFSATGNRLVTYEDNSFQFFDVDTGKSLCRLPRQSNVITFHPQPELSPSGRFFARQDTSDRIDLYRVNSGKIAMSLTRPQHNKRGGFIVKLCFSEDEQTLLGEFHESLDTGEKILVLLWDLTTGRIIQEIVLWPQIDVFWRHVGRNSKVSAFALSRDHRFLALAARDGRTVEIWEVASGTRRGQRTGHAGTVADLAFSADGLRLASGSEDTTILIWDMNRPLQPGKFKERLGEAELAAHWKTLFQPDGAKADTAIWSLVSAAKDSVPFLKSHLRPAAVPDAKRVQSLLTALDGRDFRIRSKAEAELERLGELVLDALEAALKDKNSLEKRRRLERLWQQAQKAALPFGTVERMGQWRALEVLERTGTAEAKQLLRNLAGGAARARLTQMARATLARLESRSRKPPL